jgi:hypothetical protein
VEYQDFELQIARKRREVHQSLSFPSGRSNADEQPLVQLRSDLQLEVLILHRPDHLASRRPKKYTTNATANPTNQA